MDLTATNFAYYLPWVLHELATSCFVALDLEMSGIPLYPKHQGAKPLQEHYEDTKAAAEKYQVLQVGLTICHEDKEKGGYVLRPYNISLNPCLDRNLNVNRDFTLMGWSMDFLAGHKFNVGALFTQGVRYLSRDEEVAARKASARKYAPDHSAEELQCQLRDEASVKFLQAVRREINAWAATEKTRPTILSIPPSTNSQGKARHDLPKELTCTQKWLVHRLVKVEYPGLKSRGSPTSVEIEQRNGGGMEFGARLKESEYRIRKHVGFRWIVEALVGGDLSGLEPGIFQPLVADPNGPSVSVRVLANRLKGRLQENRPILVGHNNFTDMVFFYECFLGPLPDKVEDFMALIHQTFPMLVDTKYMATQDLESMNPASSLEELNKTLAKISSPKIDLDAMFTKYLPKGSAHEAGYDSMLTAIAFLKLATNLDDGKLPKGKRGRIEDIKLGYASSYTSAVQALVPERGPNFRNCFNRRANEKKGKTTHKMGKSDASTSPTDRSSTQSDDGALFQAYQKPLVQLTGKCLEQVDGQRLMQVGEPIAQMNEPTMQMNELGLQMNQLGLQMQMPHAPVNELAMRMNELIMQMNELATPTGLPPFADTLSLDVNMKVQRGMLIPRLGSTFWGIYGNKLRVFATIEKTACIGPMWKPAKIMKMECSANIKMMEGHASIKECPAVIKAIDKLAKLEAKENRVTVNETQKTEPVQVNSNLNAEKVVPTGQLICLD